MFGASFLLGVLALTSGVAAQDAPQLKLPWGTWEAERYASDDKIYLFKNVRFGAEPERFSAPSFPDWQSDEVHRDGRPIGCPQINLQQLQHPPGGKEPMDAPDEPKLEETEDCLLLDIYAPVGAFAPGAEPLPVIVWIFGGAFAFGSKDQGGVLYSGRALLKASGYRAIFVAGNYRVGAFGWLAGNYIERVGTPNAGLHDQALLLRWVRDHVHKVGGDRHRVSAWGLSAGAGSILHHLIREDGQRDPLFHSFVAWSPGFEWAWDNSADGKLDSTYKTLSMLADCGYEYDIECLRAVPPEKMAKANQDLFNLVRQTGLFPVGPAVDGQWVKTIPPLALSQGKYWKGITGAIVSHATNESGPFVPDDILSQERFDDFLEVFLPGDSLGPERDAIRGQYNCVQDFGSDFKACMGAVIQHLVFTCNTRFLFDAFPQKTYAMQYGFPLDGLALHGVDLAPLFCSTFAEARAFLLKAGLTDAQATLYAGALMSLVSPAYTKFFASFALSGDPNELINIPPVKWLLANGDGDALSEVVKVRYGLTAFQAYARVSDEMNTRSSCSFWEGIAGSIVDKMGEGRKRDEL